MAEIMPELIAENEAKVVAEQIFNHQ